MAPTRIATLATIQSLDDLKIFLKSLNIWYTKETCPTIYLYTDLRTMNYLKDTPEFDTMRIIYNCCLDMYSKMNRAQMEQIPRGNKTLWYEFQMEKMNLLDWVFATDPSNEGVFYLDSDICFFAPLPEIPSTCTVALSPHHIALKDEAKFGKYNGGFLWVKDPTAIEAWRSACPSSRFHEQAALEIFDSAEWSETLYTFPIQYNYGWWRFWQGRESPDILQRYWTVDIMSKESNHSGILVNGKPLGSVHTHFHNSSDNFTKFFNEFVINFLKQIKWAHEPAKQLLELV